jgi:SAM-dependent methyltransferase
MGSPQVPPTASDDVRGERWRDEDWNREQQRYWDGISASYDGLYRSYWSRRENDWVGRRLSFLRRLPAPTVLDLGCGTGLGLLLVRQVNPYAQYIGLDISEEMTQGLADAGAKVVIRSMDDLSFLGDGKVDVVISLFSSLSYAFRTEEVFAEVSRVLAPGGHAYLSVLSSHALSRLRAGNVRGEYRTRGDRRPGDTIPVRRHTCAEVRVIGERAGLRPLWVTGMNLFSGLAEMPRLWTAGRIGALFTPDRAHTIEALFRKGDAPDEPSVQ